MAGQKTSIVGRVAVRYLRSKKRTGFVSFMSFASMLGIALGVMVLIAVLSVINGFDVKIKQQFFSLASPVTINFPAADLAKWQQYAPTIKQAGKVTGIAPFIASNAMVSDHGSFAGLNVFGINPDIQQHFSDLRQSLIAGSLQDLKSNRFSIIIGASLATRLNLDVGDSINLVIPQLTSTPMGSFPRYRRCKIVGIFKASEGFGYDLSVAYMNISDAKILFAGAQTTYGVNVRLQDIYKAIPVTTALRKSLPMDLSVTNWTETSGGFFQALAMEKTMLFVVLMFIILVAVFNLVSSLMIMVNDKQADIAILRTLGATPGTIMRIFMLQGFLVGLIGTILGVGLGVLLSLNLTAIANWLQGVLGVQFVDPGVYFLSYLPSQMQFSDIVHVVLFALLFSFLATIYPAWAAFRTQPAEALRYE